MKRRPARAWLLAAALVAASPPACTSSSPSSSEHTPARADPAPSGAAAETATAAEPPPRPGAPAPCLSVRVVDRLFRCPDGQPFRWRGVTGFRLVKDVADGRWARAERYLDWARAAGFSIVRVLTVERLLFDLAPDAGRAALPRALQLAQARGLVLEVVAISDSAERTFDYVRHARLVAEACARAVNCVYEFANEPGHGSQAEALHDMAAVDRLAAAATAGLPLVWAAGPSWTSDTAPVPTGRYVTRHLERAGSGWRQAGRVAALAELSRALGKPVVNDEPIGFDEQDGALTGRQRIADCDVALAFGVLSRVFEVGTTFHLQAGLQNDEPGPVQRRCAEAFIAGTRVVPDAMVLAAAPPGTADSPLPAGEAPAEGWRHAGVSGQVAIVVAAGRPADGAPSWAEGWRTAAVVADRPSIRIWRVERR